MRPAETAVVVPIPEAEGVVGPYRARLDHAAELGVPAHVTVIAPFAPPDLIDAVWTLNALIGSFDRSGGVFGANCSKIGGCCRRSP